MKNLAMAFILFTSAAFAQPVEGPWLVMEATDSTTSLYSISIAVVDQDTARIFYATDSLGQNTVWTALYAIEEHTLTSPPDFVRSDAYQNILKNASTEGTDAWLLIYMRRFSASSTITRSISGNGNSRFDFEIGASHPSSDFFAGVYTSGVDLARRIGGGWTMTWARSGDTGPPYHDEWYSKAFVAGSSRDSIEYVQELVADSAGVDFDLPYMAAGFLTAEDTALVIIQGHPDSDHPAMLLRTVIGNEPSTFDTICTYTCSIDPISLRPTDTEELLAYSADNYIADNTLLRVNQTGDCMPLGSLTYSYSPTQLAYHENYGFVGIWYNPNWIMISRMNLDGTGTEPGIFYWRDDEHIIRSAALAITDNGRIHVTWVEGPDSTNRGTRILTGWINWNTPLTSPESTFIPHPSSFILSAYPNPFNSTTTISFDLPRAAELKLMVFDITGRHVRTLINQKMESGHHGIAFAAENLASGIYFCRLKAGETGITQKMVLLR